MEEKRKMEAARKKRIEAEQMTRDHQLARRLSQQENGLHRPPHSGKHKSKTGRDKKKKSNHKLRLSTTPCGSLTEKAVDIFFHQKNLHIGHLEELKKKNNRKGNKER